MTDINDGRQASQAAESSHCNPTGRGPLPLRSGPRAVPALSAPSVPRLAVGVSLPERTPTPQQGAPRGRTTAETPLRSRDALTRRNWPGRKRCWINAGGRFRAHLPSTPPCRAGRGRGRGGRFGPLLAVAGGRKWYAQPEIRPVQPLFQVAVPGGYCTKRRCFHETKKNRKSGTQWPG